MKGRPDYAQRNPPPGSGDQVGSGDLKFTGDAGLAKTTGGRKGFWAVLRPSCLHRFGIEVVPAFILVMTFFGDRTRRTPLHALSAFFISEEKAIFLRVVVSPITRR